MPKEGQLFGYGQFFMKRLQQRKEAAKSDLSNAPPDPSTTLPDQSQTTIQSTSNAPQQDASSSEDHQHEPPDNQQDPSQKDIDQTTGANAIDLTIWDEWNLLTDEQQELWQEQADKINFVRERQKITDPKEK